MTRHTIFQIAAVLLLLLMGAQLFACDVLGTDRCDQQQTVDDDCCICCCVHIVMDQPTVLEPQETLVAFSIAPAAGVPLPQPANIYHPPKS